MPEPPPCPERTTLRFRLREALARLDERLEVVAEDVLGLDSRIDLVARDARGGLVAVLVAEPGGDLERLADALAQSAWLEPRIADWLKFAPGLGLRPERGVRLILAAADFDPRTLAATGRLGEAAPSLLRLPGARSDGGRALARPEAPSPTTGAAGAAPTGPVASVFRTGLDPQDL
jgi:hypothetical protein